MNTCITNISGGILENDNHSKFLFSDIGQKKLIDHAWPLTLPAPPSMIANVTGFVKRGIPHTSTFTALGNHNFM